MFVNYEDIWIHPKYKEKEAYYDIAVVKIPFTNFTQTIKPICLPEDIDPIGTKYEQRLATVIGWGSFNISNIASTQLKFARWEIYDSK